MDSVKKSVAVIGAGPAGLMAAEVLVQQGIDVAIYDAMPSVGRKFLMAGKGGMNITHAEPFAQFVSRYGEQQQVLEPMLIAFSPQMLRDWIQDLGISTFVGSSGRVFPQEMKAAPLLRNWLHRLRTQGVRFHMRHRWLGWSEQGALLFAANDAQHVCHADAVVLALGGGSWPHLGSTGDWQAILRQRGVDVATLKPANCGFETCWSDYFSSRFAGQPLKPVTIYLQDQALGTTQQQGELVITEQGLEGGAIYAVSRLLRNAIEQQAQVTILLDLCPNRTEQDILSRLNKPRGKDSLSNYLRKRLGIEGVKFALLKEIVSAEVLNNPEQLATALKALPITLTDTRPLPEAISSAGGVSFGGLDARLMLKSLPSVFCAGEMLDWEAPTGGYLLTGCLASGRVAGLGALAWLAE